MVESYHAGQMSQLSLFAETNYVDIQQLTLFDPTGSTTFPSQISARSKKCSKCKEHKSIDEYSQRKNGRYEARCRECICKADRIRHNTDKNNIKRRENHAKKLALSDNRLLNSPAPPPSTVLFKVCPRCDPPIKKPIEEFGLSKDRKDGHTPYCRDCTAKIAHARIDKNRAWAAKRRSDPEWQAEQVAMRREWRHRNAERLREQGRLKYATDPEYARRVLANTAAWYEANPMKRREFVMRRKARKGDAAWSEVSYEGIIERDGMFCYICGQEIRIDQSLEFDHRIPLSRGGAHIEENISPTHACCNRRKWNKLIEEMSDFQRRGPND